MTMIHIMSKESTSTLTAVQPQDIQPNAVDLRLGKVFQINDENDFTIDEEQKIHKGSTPVPLWEDGYWYLSSGAYEVIMENEVEVGHDECGFVITRSNCGTNLRLIHYDYPAKTHVERMPATGLIDKG